MHHVTIAGMVQAPLNSNAYAVLKVFSNELVLDGLGTTVASHASLPSRRLRSESPRLNMVGASASVCPFAFQNSKL